MTYAVGLKILLLLESFHSHCSILLLIAVAEANPKSFLDPPLPTATHCNDSMSSRGLSVPDGDGLWIVLLPNGMVSLELEADRHFPDIHPNCYAPSSLSEVSLLKGGGSGTAVFGGEHPRFGKVVMKHGNYKDTREVLSLARIKDELSKRPDRRAASNMQQRIPELVGVFIAKRHLRDRGRELWHTLREKAFEGLLKETRRRSTLRSSLGSSPAGLFSDEDYDWDEDQPEHTEERAISIEKDNQRDIRVEAGENLELQVNFRSVVLSIPGYRRGQRIREGYTFLAEFCEELAYAQKANNWKVTLVQKSIGGRGSENGASSLAGGRLVGSLLWDTVRDMNDIIEDLRKLTHQDEKDVLAQMKKECMTLRDDPDVLKVSETLDQFCGSAILKNYRPGGRFPTLRDFGRKFRDHTLILAPKERFPASFLGVLLTRGVDLSHIFTDPPCNRSVLDTVEDSWCSLVDHALTIESRSATDRIWTCGLTDAGLHNTFVSQDRGMELFDLGEPSLMPQPAFLTKFLMSFFHTLGMQDSNDDDGWIRRFDVKQGKLVLTKESKEAIPVVLKSFSYAMDQFVGTLFEGDTRVQSLLVRYVVLQLLSDASFCLQRWEQKGGGKERIGERAGIGKWLWRAIWDIYIACDVHRTQCSP